MNHLVTMHPGRFKANSQLASLCEALSSAVRITALAMKLRPVGLAAYHANISTPHCNHVHETRHAPECGPDGMYAIISRGRALPCGPATATRQHPSQRLRAAGKSSEVLPALQR